MSDKGFKVKNGLTIQGTVDTLITADNAGGVLVNGNPIVSNNFVQMTTVSVSSNITLETNKRYLVNTSAARTLTLPASPANGDEIQVFDVTGTAATNKITVASNSLKINGTVQDLEIDINSDVVALVYTGTTYGWVVI
jgi:hypothetical protein